jgi:hypothetical protein
LNGAAGKSLHKGEEEGEQVGTHAEGKGKEMILHAMAGAYLIVPLMVSLR